MVRRCVTTLRLRSDRFTLWRVRLAADLVLAIADQKLVDVDARERSCDCQPPKKAPGSLPYAVPYLDASVTTVCSMRAWLFAARQRALRPFAFVRQ
jgi:hypothetical protein